MLDYIAENLVWVHNLAELNKVVSMIVLQFIKLNTGFFYLLIKPIKSLSLLMLY